MGKVVTSKRLEQMKIRLAELQAERLNLGRNIGEAASHGGATLSKIPEYAAIVEALQLLDERVRRLGEEVSVSRVIEPHLLPEDRVSVLSRVRVVDFLTGAMKAYYFGDAAVLSERIEGVPVTQASPIGKALLVKCVGDIAEVELPSGKYELKIVAIERLEEEV